MKKNNKLTKEDVAVINDVIELISNGKIFDYVEDIPNKNILSEIKKLITSKLDDIIDSITILKSKFLDEDGNEELVCDQHGNGCKEVEVKFKGNKNFKFVALIPVDLFNDALDALDEITDEELEDLFNEESDGDDQNSPSFIRGLQKLINIEVSKFWKKVTKSVSKISSKSGEIFKF